MRVAASRFGWLSCRVLVLFIFLLASPAFGQLGAISGTMRAAETLELLDGWVEIYDSEGQSVAVASGGEWTADGLPAGAYFLVADQSTAYRKELWQGLTCIDEDCEFQGVTGGTPVTVSPGQTTSGIDFVLEKWPRIEGRVVASGAGSPLASIEVFAFKAASGQLMSFRETDSQGFYHLPMLDPDTYKIVVFATDDYYQEVWDGVTCGVDDCDLSVGQAVVLDFGEAATSIDFALEPRNTFFRDGFESADFGAWSEVQGN